MAKRTIEDRHTVYALWHFERKSAAQITRTTQLPYSFVKYWIRRFRSGYGTEDLPRTGRPKKATSKVLQKVKATMKGKRHTPSRVVSSKLARRGVNISHATVCRTARSAGLRPHRVYKKPRLTAVQKTSRLKFAKKHRFTNWRKVIFSDEKTWQTFMGPGGKDDIVWTDNKDDPSLVAETVKKPTKVQVWGGVSYYGKLPLHFFEEELDAKLYKRILEKTMLPAAQELMSAEHPDDWIFQQDGDSAHTAKSTKSWLDVHVPQHLTLPHWPSNSPDINIIENVWGIVSADIRKHNATSKLGLKKSIKKAWDNLKIETIRNLYDSVPRRMKAVIRAKGDRTRY